MTTAASVEASRSEPVASAPAPRTPVVSRSPEEEELVDLAGFAGHLAPAAQRHPRRHEAVAALALHLSSVRSVFPADAQEDLKRTAFYFTERTSSRPLFHPDTGDGSAQPAKAGIANAIEIPSISVLVEVLQTGTRGLFANLLAAGYFMHLPSPPWKEADEAFRLARTNLMTAGLGSDALSYFSALSTAYFTRSAMPAERALLRAADPRGVDLVARTWPGRQGRAN
jgi:hypothetical protein